MMDFAGQKMLQAIDLITFSTLLTVLCRTVQCPLFFRFFFCIRMRQPIPLGALSHELPEI